MANLTDLEFATLWKRHGGPVNFAKREKMDYRNIMRRRIRVEKNLGIILDAEHGTPQQRTKAHVTKIGFRITEDVKDGCVVVFSDAHWWPGERSASFEALLSIIKRLKPGMVVCNGDAFDGARISRHAPGGWASLPDVADELSGVQERLGEIEAIAPKDAKLVWTIGNHDSRFTSRLAQYAPEYMRVKGMDITDHFEAWNFGWSLWLNNNVIIKHRNANGVHGAYNNVLKGGKTIVTGHTHRLQSIMFADYNGLRWGIECGTLSDFGPENDKYAYSEDGPFNWSQGFLVLNFVNGVLMEPELCRVMNGKAYFRGEVVK